MFGAPGSKLEKYAPEKRRKQHMWASEGLLSEKKEAIRVEGRVDEPAPNDTWIVKLDSGHYVTTRLSDKLRMLPVRLIPGDRVLVELSPYDLTRGQIVERIKQMK